MKTAAILILFLIVAPLSAQQVLQNLDSLIKASDQQVLKFRPAQPTTLAKLYPLDSAPRRVVLRPLFNRGNDLEERLRTVETNVTKVSIILENMQKTSENHTDRFNSVMQFFGILVTAVAGIIVALIGVYFKGKKK